MNILTYSEARANFKTTMDEVCLHSEPTIITRSSGEPVIMMSLNDFNSLKETLYLLSTPKNASELMKSIAQLEASRTLTRGLIDNEQKEKRK